MTAAQRAAERRLGEPLRERLRTLRWVEGKTVEQIARQARVSRATMQAWLREYGLTSSQVAKAQSDGRR